MFIIVLTLRARQLISPIGGWNRRIVCLSLSLSLSQRSSACGVRPGQRWFVDCLDVLSAIHNATSLTVVHGSFKHFVDREDQMLLLGN
jgi:hypothetical protein